MQVTSRHAIQGSVDRVDFSRCETPVLRLLILLSAIILQMCLGATYAWNTFVEPLKLHSGWTQAAAGLPFTCFYIMFPATTLFAGTLLRRWGPRRCAVAGGVFFGSGWMLAGLGGGNLAITLLGIGLLGGLGAGLAYMVPITVAMLWYPRHRALVTGLAVAGFGGGAFLVGKAASWIMQAQGTAPHSALLLLGAAFLLAIPSAGIFMRYPGGAGPDAAPARIPLAVLRQPLFWLLYFAMFSGLLGGLAVNANLKQLLPAGAITATAAVGWFALGNALGRIGWGFLYDRVRSIVSIRANLAMQAVVLLSLGFLDGSALAFTVFVFLVGFSYGGVLVIYASTAARVWGTQQVGSIYGWMLSSNIPAALAPALAGYVYDRSGSFMPALYCIAFLQIAAALLMRNPELRAPISKPLP